MEMDRGKMISHFHQTHFLRENGNVRMEMIPFQNGNEMDSAGWGGRMEIAEWKQFHFAKWKWKCEMEVGSRNFHFHFENGIKMDPK